MQGFLCCYICDRPYRDHPGVGPCPFPRATYRRAAAKEAIPAETIHGRPHERGLVILPRGKGVGHVLSLGGDTTLCGRPVRRPEPQKNPNPLCRDCERYRRLRI